MFYIFGLLFFEGKLFAQQNVNSIETDRPDITESAVVVPSGLYQLESGTLFENKNMTSEGIKINFHNYTIITSMLRVGLINNVELRFAGDYLNQTVMNSSNQSNNTGFANILAGAKYQFTKQEVSGQDLGIIIQLYLPVGNEVFTPPNTEPEILLAYGKDFSETFSLSANIGSRWNGTDNLMIFLYSASFGIKVNDYWDSFLELYGDASKGNPFNYNFDCGIAYRLLDNLQFDASIGDELSTGIENYFISAGISVRMPK